MLKVHVALPKNQKALPGFPDNALSFFRKKKANTAGGWTVLALSAIAP